MTKSEVAKLFERIVWFYPAFTGDMDKLNAWHEVMHDVSFETAMTNLKRHARTGKFPPTVAELTGDSNEGNPYVPGVEETRAYLAQLEEHSRQAREDWERRAAGPVTNSDGI